MAYRGIRYHIEKTNREGTTTAVAAVETIKYQSDDCCLMFTFVVGIDKDESRAKAQADAITSMPLETEEVQAILVHSFSENPEGGTIEQVKPVRVARKRLEEAGIEVIPEGYGGNAAQAILNVADEWDAEQIVLAGRKRTPTGKVLFGSVTQSVILDTERPVLVCSADE
jgi:nucleotide-binding universal stress UspA family protein